MRQNLPSKGSEEILSMILGLIIVGAVVMLVVNVFSRFKGKVDVPGISDEKQLVLIGDQKIKEAAAKKQTDKVTEKTDGGNYTVKRGDNLWKIAQNTYGDGNKWTQIAQANKLKNPRLVFSGQKLVLPKQTVAETKPKTAPVKTAMKQNKTTVHSGETYVVKKGDSLWKISVIVYADGYQWTKIWNNNRKLVTNPGLIYAGTKLTLPAVRR